MRVPATILPSVAARAPPVAAALTTMIGAPITVRDGQPRPILVNAARALIAAVRSERASWPVSAPERQFYLGVEGAALEVLHPELSMARTAEWLDSQVFAYRDGYLRTSTLITGARRDPERAAVFPLPDVSLAI